MTHIGANVAGTAQADLRNVGLTPGATRTVLDNNVAKGLVIKTIPANGSRIARGGEITLIVSAGPHMIKMPQVTGLKPLSTTPSQSSSLPLQTSVLGVPGVHIVELTPFTQFSTVRRHSPAPQLV